MSTKERKIRNLEHEIKYYERVYKNCKKLDELRNELRKKLEELKNNLK